MTLPAPGSRTTAPVELTRIQIAEAVARAAHFGQRSLTGEDFFESHLQPVADAIVRAGGRGTPLHVAALLHDVIVDTRDDPHGGFTAATLRRAGVSERAIRIVEVLTRQPEETYAAYIHRVSLDPEARLVKLAETHVKLESMPRVAAVDPEAAVSLTKRYERAERVLTMAVEGSL